MMMINGASGSGSGSDESATIVVSAATPTGDKEIPYREINNTKPPDFDVLRLCTLVLLQHLLLHYFTLLTTSFVFLFVIHQLVPIIHYQFNSTGL
ncbi:unnamed protein product [Lactuca saligna]|uniref:Uncharacterized protein n=1 Tax=Lactuca saligna TaxID=75948 RepID=A0AA36EIH1_LACSI|nr:unnamed protein product [Lactuca saligna]